MIIMMILDIKITGYLLCFLFANEAGAYEGRLARVLRGQASVQAEPQLFHYRGRVGHGSTSGCGAWDVNYQDQFHVGNTNTNRISSNNSSNNNSRIQRKGLVALSDAAKSSAFSLLDSAETTRDCKASELAATTSPGGILLRRAIR